MSVRMRVNKSATGNRRSGHGLEEPRTSTCSNCGKSHLRHRMCAECGHYRGRLVTDVAAKAEKKADKLKVRQRDIGEEKAEVVKDEEKPRPTELSPEELSHKSEAK